MVKSIYVSKIKVTFVQTPEQLRANDYSEMNKSYTISWFIDSSLIHFLKLLFIHYIIVEKYLKIQVIRKVKHVFWFEHERKARKIDNLHLFSVCFFTKNRKEG